MISSSAHEVRSPTLVERKMRLTLLIGLPTGHSAPQIGDALIATFAQLPPKLPDTDLGPGQRDVSHERIEAATGLKIYFADPHSPWQRGTNENTVSVESGSVGLLSQAGAGSSR
nr:hypothetical protein [Spelaeibacter cavernicola]